MCEKATDREYNEKSAATGYNQAVQGPKESHMTYELKQQREFYIRKLMDIQRAIDAVEGLRY